MATAPVVNVFGPVGRRRQRAGAAIGAVLGALVAYALARLAIGTIHQPAFGAGLPKALSPGFVALVAAIGALLGWAAIALLERVSTHATAIWTVAAALVLLVSLSMPLSGHGVSAGNRVALMVMHLVVGGVVITLYRASSPTRSGRR